MIDNRVGVFATFHPHPEKLDDLRQSLETMQVNSRNEPGCQVYDLYQSGDDEISLHIVELYKDEGALEGHRQTDHYKAYRAALSDQLAKPIEVAVLQPLSVQRL